MSAELAEIRYMPLAEVWNQPLEWSQVKAWSFKPHYELRAGEHLVATMQQDGIMKTSTTVYSADGAWQLARHGFFRMHIDVTAIGRAEPALRVDMAWNGGNLNLPDGRVLEFRGTNFWGTKYAFREKDSKRPLITYHYHGLLKYNAHTALTPDVASLPHLTVLVSLGWYLLVMQMMDAAVAAA